MGKYLINTKKEILNCHKKCKKIKENSNFSKEFEKNDVVYFLDFKMLGFLSASDSAMEIYERFLFNQLSPLQGFYQYRRDDRIFILFLKPNHSLGHSMKSEIYSVSEIFVSKDKKEIEKLADLLFKFHLKGVKKFNFLFEMNLSNYNCFINCIKNKFPEFFI